MGTQLAAAFAMNAAADPLQAYRAKRNFAITPEPAKDPASAAGRGRFVIQKHWASRLHYDFRLELAGTLKSWAVPKGPSLDPKDKRMAVQVEDHPLSYGDFEGTIPPGQYGAGRVIVWDLGTWQPLGDAEAGYRDGHLKFELKGRKLQGRWVLVRLKGRGEKQPPWLLIKEQDAHVRAAADYSVVDALPDSVKEPVPTAPEPPAKPADGPPDRGRPPTHPTGAVRAALPASLQPQLATLVRAPPDDAADWVFEVKFDGYRLLARVDGKQVALFTRTGLDWTHRLPHLHEVMRGLQLPPGWYDGEIVVAGPNGMPDFGALQRSFDAQRTRDVVFHVFDLPYFDGYDLRAVPLYARRALLEQLLERHPSDTLRFSAVFDAAPQHLLASACQLGLEGVIGKRREAPYRSTRSADWIKLKCGQRQEFVIGGYTDPKGSRSGLGALLLGVYDSEGALRHAGNVGTGFTEARLRELRQTLAPLARRDSPFAGPVAAAGHANWVEPRLVAEVAFAEWTHSGHVRQAVFLGLRDDKKPEDIVRETPAVPPAASAAPSPPASAGGPSARRATGSPAMRVSNPDRVVDAQTGLTKADLVRYYKTVSALMMPHLKGRAVSLVRAPAGLAGELFFQKHASGDTLEGVDTLDPALSPGHAPLLTVSRPAGLLSGAQWNVIEFHTQNADASDHEHPNRIVFDLDPGEGVAWPQVREAAELTRAFLVELGLAPFLKTSGGKGLHVVVPLRRQHDWDTAKGFSQAVVAHMSRTIPQRFVAKSGPKNRVGKIFIDYLRNGSGATTVSAWSARARPGMGISVPVDWSELPTLRGGDHWTVATVHERLSTGNGPWAQYARSARGLARPIKTLQDAA